MQDPSFQWLNDILDSPSDYDAISLFEECVVDRLVYIFLVDGLPNDRISKDTNSQAYMSNSTMEFNVRHYDIVYADDEENEENN